MHTAHGITSIVDLGSRDGIGPAQTIDGRYRVQVYCCDPQRPRQRGTNENTNRWLRQYLPKCTDLSRYSQTNLDTMALRMNLRPRQPLGFQTPAAILEAAVATTLDPTDLQPDRSSSSTRSEPVYSMREHPRLLTREFGHSTLSR